MTTTKKPSVVGLFTAPTQAAAMVSSSSIEAVSGKGLVGDRYYLGTGIYSNVKGWGAQVSLIQQEAIDAVNAGHQTDYKPEMLRRNIVTQGIDLTTLLCREFRCGDAILRGIKPYPPCTHLARLIDRKDVLKYFAYSCGIGAEVIQGGIICVGDLIELMPQLQWTD